MSVLGPENIANPGLRMQGLRATKHTAKFERSFSILEKNFFVVVRLGANQGKALLSNDP